MGASQDLPLGVRELVASPTVKTVWVDSCQQACDPSVLARADAVVVCPSPHMPDASSTDADKGLPTGMSLLADALISHRLTGVVLSSDTTGVEPDGDNPFFFVSPDATFDELWGRVATVRRYRSLLYRMEEQVAVMQRLGKRLNQNFAEMDQELHLASRLQRDFLPKELPQIGDVRFTTLYRPAGWVSGDVYDIRRLDEEYVGFYVADAVGHGVAAGLLTMFIKQAIKGKRIESQGYTIIPPGEVLEALNVELANQQLPNCQFVTACYATIDTATHTLTFARGGHPHPIHVNAQGVCTEVRTVGGLLGVFPGERFPSVSLTLQPGEKLILYSDGLEDAIIARRQRYEGNVTFCEPFLEIAQLPTDQFIDALTECLDHTEGSLEPNDDITVLVAERLG